MRKNTSNPYTTNRKMNDETYKLRREVMKHIYEAKKLIGASFPRVDVRIADANSGESALGVARTGDNIIWITPVAIGEYDLRAVVYHEICHTVYCLDHNEDCPLMKSKISRGQKFTKAKLDKILKSYAV